MDSQPLVNQIANPHKEYNPKVHFVAVVLEYIGIFIALCPFVCMVNWIFVPHALVGGGLTGICSAIYYATQGFFPTLFASYNGAIPIWLSTVVINALLLTVAGFTVGWRFCIRTIFGVLVVAFWYRLIPIREVPIIADPMLGCIIGGVAFGLSLGIVMLCNGSSGGTDIVAMIVNHYKDVGLGKVLVLCDLVIILSAYFLPVPATVDLGMQSVTDYKTQRILCGLSMTVSYTAALDWFMNRVRQSVQFFIFSRRHEEISQAISSTVRRGVTLLDGKGWYSGQPITVVTVLARKHETNTILKLIQQIDPDAFVSCSNVNGVFGSGFDHIKS
ncbi:MAG: YitT family protein [Paludibacteraceae bacterium]|nr:YitT family protein [Paludibacteraceae bacterium]